MSNPFLLRRRCFCLFAAALMVGCGADDRGFLVVVEGSLYEPLETSLEVYSDSVEAEGFEVYVESWNPGTVDELKALLFDHVDRHHIEGALLIGDLPAAKYEGIFDTYFEEFPTDLYLQDRDAIWEDRNGNTTFDHHSEIKADIYTSRLVGTTNQLLDYFARVEYYRHVGSLVDVSAFIFIDDDWQWLDTSDLFRLGETYSTVEVVQARADSTLGRYLEKLIEADGAEFVYQWIHAAPGWVGFEDVDEQGQWVQTKVKAEAIADWNLKVSFVSMANCYSALFTDPKASLAQAFTVGTEYGLAVIGSTKRGAPTQVRLFHQKLAEGLSWGQAYKLWFNEEGRQNYEWNLGIVLMGDPLLTVRGDLGALDRTAPCMASTCY